MRRARWHLAVGVLTGVVGLMGCVPQADYDALNLAHRRLQSETEKLRQDLTAARSRVAALESQVAALQSDLRTKEELASTLKTERDRYYELYRKVEADFSSYLAKEKGPIVVERVLPPELDAALQAFAQRHPDAVVYDPKLGALKWRSDLLFASGSDVVRESALDTLREFSEIARSPAAEGFDVIVVGHTDNVRIGKPQTRAKHPTNWHLSAHRAISVAQVLLNQGLSPTRVGVMGFGEYRPVASNDTPAGREKNRRVEIYLKPHTESPGAAAATLASEVKPAPKKEAPAGAVK